MATTLPSTTKRVLVVDDNQDGRDTLARVLTLMNFTVMTARDGAAALRCAETFLPEAVLLDVLMPGISGFQVAQKLREHPQLKDILLISMSGFDLGSSDLLWQRSGCNYHLVKPLDVNVLEELLRRTPTSTQHNGQTQG